MTEIDITRLERLEHRTDDPQAPEVFFTPIITPDSLIAVYHALGATPEGKVAIKIHSGESEKSNNLNPSLVKDLVQEIGGTLVECATAYDDNRETPEKSLNVFKERGYGDIAPIQIMDMGVKSRFRLRNTSISRTTSSVCTLTITIPSSCFRISKGTRWAVSAAR